MCTVSMRQRGLNDSNLQTLFNKLNPGCLVLLEDVDCAAWERTPNGDNAESGMQKRFSEYESEDDSASDSSEDSSESSS